MTEGTPSVSEVSSRRTTPGKLAFGALSSVTGVAVNGSEPGAETRPVVRADRGTVNTGKEFAFQSEHRSEMRTSLYGHANRYPRATQSEAKPIDAALLKRAEETLNSLDDADEIDMQLLLAGLVGIVSDLWESAAEASDIHQEILATLENGVRVAAGRGRSLSTDESLAIRGAVHFLKQPRLVRSNAESIRSEFVEAGFQPLGFLEE